MRELPTYVKKDEFRFRGLWPSTQAKDPANIQDLGLQPPPDFCYDKEMGIPEGDISNLKAFHAVLWGCFSFSVYGGRNPEN